MENGRKPTLAHRSAFGTLSNGKSRRGVASQWHDSELHRRDNPLQTYGYRSMGFPTPNAPRKRPPTDRTARLGRLAGFRCARKHRLATTSRFM